MAKTGIKETGKKGKVKELAFVIIIIVLLAVAAIIVNYYAKKEMPFYNFDQAVCLAEVRQDISYCSRQDFTEYQKNICLESAYHVDLIMNKNLAVMDKLTLKKSMFEAIAHDELGKCNGEKQCEAVVSNDVSLCVGNKGCEDYYNMINAIREKNADYCENISGEKDRKECSAIVLKKPELCEDLS